MSLDKKIEDFFDTCKGEKAERTQRFRILKRECPVLPNIYCSKRYTIYEKFDFQEPRYFCLFNASYKKT